jgi:hypothetical protein
VRRHALVEVRGKGGGEPVIFRLELGFQAVDLLLVLFLRPSGLFGRSSADRV